MKKCAIVIPVWKKMISEEEFKSLIQCSMVLGKNPLYDIMFLSKGGIDEQYYNFAWKTTGQQTDAKFITFPERCFESRLSYSYLLTSREFYSKFFEYENILIYQLDAWVFSDSLMEWCDKGYDYIGAPWCHLCRMGNGCADFVSSSFIGNGGLSLRKVKSFIEKLPYVAFDDAMYNDSLTEDIYVSLMSDFKKPKCDEAGMFSVETNAAKQIESHGGKLPFGFHGLQIYDRGLYEKLVEETFVGKEIMENVKMVAE